MGRFSRRPSPATVISLIALFVALGGTGYAATKLSKNSVGAKQLKKNAVTGKKVKNNAITGAKVKDDSLSGADILEAALAKVPAAVAADSALTAGNATTATKATNADNATTAGTATNVAPGEDWHEVGKPGEPAFENGCEAYTEGNPPTTAENYVEPPAFYKDKLGVVHLKGIVSCPSSSQMAFMLPAGYRPAPAKIVLMNASCPGCTATDSNGDIYNPGDTPVLILGAGAITDGSLDGALVAGGELVSLDNLQFRAAG